jgi:hypothetical protein
VLYYLLAAHPGRTIVFVNAVSTARRVAALLKLLKMPSSALHAGAHATPSSNSSGCQCCRAFQSRPPLMSLRELVPQATRLQRNRRYLANTESCSECLHVMDVDEGCP